MSWRVVTDAGWIVIAAAICGLAIASHRSASLACVGHVVRRVMSRRGARIVVLLVWMWLGWHTFAR